MPARSRPRNVIRLGHDGIDSFLERASGTYRLSSAARRRSWTLAAILATSALLLLIALTRTRHFHSAYEQTAVYVFASSWVALAIAGIVASADLHSFTLTIDSSGVARTSPIPFRSFRLGRPELRAIELFQRGSQSFLKLYTASGGARTTDIPDEQWPRFAAASGG